MDALIEKPKKGKIWQSMNLVMKLCYMMQQMKKYMFKLYSLFDMEILRWLSYNKSYRGRNE